MIDDISFEGAAETIIVSGGILLIAGIAVGLALASLWKWSFVR